MKLVISLVKRPPHAVVGDLVFTRPLPEALRVQVCRLNMRPFCGCEGGREGTLGHLRAVAIVRRKRNLLVAPWCVLSGTLYRLG